MITWYRRLTMLTCILVLIFAMTGCKKRETRKVRVHEEQQRGDVQEDRPGEMIVE